MPGSIPKKLSSRHLVAAHLRAHGVGWKRIADHLGYDYSTVRHFWLAPAFQAEVSRLQHEIHAGFVSRMAECLRPSDREIEAALGFSVTRLHSQLQ